MIKSDFYIGLEFWTYYKRFRCTDVGTRVIVAIELDNREDQSWFDGPPYAVEEIVFDENDFAGCFLQKPGT